MYIINNIKEILYRYSLDTKLKICHYYSSKITNLNGISRIQQSDYSKMPWILEKFAYYSILYDLKCIRDTEINEKAIHDTQIVFELIFKLMYKDINNNSIKYFTLYLGTLQFKSQEDFLYLMYRNNHFFNFKSEDFNLKRVFEEKFNSPYKSFKDLAISLVNLNNTYPIDIGIKNYIYKKFEDVIDNLMVDIDSLNNKIQNERLNSFNILWQKPFIKRNNEILLPLPHLLYRAISDAILFRITENNDKIRDNFGKYCLEDYLLHLIIISDQFEKVFSEIIFDSAKGEVSSSDVIAESEKNIVLFEIKSSVPSNKIRHIDENSIYKNIKQYASAVVQLYKQISLYFNEYDLCSEKDHYDNIFGIVVLLEDSYIQRKLIYDEAYTQLKNNDFEISKEWLESNIIIVSLYEIETAVFERTNIVNKLIERKLSNKKYDLINFSNPGGVYLKEFLLFKKRQKVIIEKIFDEIEN